MTINIYAIEANVRTDIESIQAAGAELVKYDKVVPDFIDACTEREKTFPTALALPFDTAIAMPHGESKYVKEDSISFVRLKHPVTFHLMDDSSKEMECSLVFNLALASGGKHLEILRKLMKLFQDDTFVHKCMTENISELPAYLENQLV